MAPEHFVPVAWQKWKLVGYLAVLALSIIFGSAYAGPLAAPVKVFFVVLGALQFIGVFGLMHESAHGHLAASRKVNRWLGEAMSVIVGTSYPGYRAAHLTHHAKFRTEADPQEIIFPRRSAPATMALLTVASVVGAPVFLLVRAPIIALKHTGVVRALWGPVAAVALYATLSQVLPSAQWYFLLWTLIAGSVLGSLNDMVYHQGLVAEDTLQACTSFDCDLFGQVFLSGANRHAEHHAYPDVPGPRLVKVAKVLREDFHARGIPYERSFTVAYLRRFTTNPLFLPPRSAVEPVRVEK
ncbi:fatty acid desaturase [Actinokineospora auranticolor]|uniref:fatty acid desaturase family protein n=1 Tax=Actinokineospora auranticolor TaxID=155976 RepID=UPI001C68091A|nr:fatty acid desaturase [Actinokineospora auranticolor]